MNRDYIHVEVEESQSSKYDDRPCGDVLDVSRSLSATTVLCVDGIGSGFRGRIAAKMATARLLELMERGMSVRKAFQSVVTTMEGWRDPNKPFAAFSVARILRDGMTSILTYDAPAPILVGRSHATELKTRPFNLGGTLVTEAHCYLEPGEGILLTSDGITQSGMGVNHSKEWGTEGVLRFVDELRSSGLGFSTIADMVRREAVRRWLEGDSHWTPDRTSPLTPLGVKRSPLANRRKMVQGDDCSVVLAHCRAGHALNILTGPPNNMELDEQLVARFMRMQGLKVVCGGSTSSLVARCLGEKMRVEQKPTSLIAPPRYEINGVDLVTEGAVTLNQVYNLLEEEVDIRELTEDSGVTELVCMLKVADQINIILGDAVNKGSGDISFRQRGILMRSQIVPLIAQRLEKSGKLVVVEKASNFAMM